MITKPLVSTLIVFTLTIMTTSCTEEKPEEIVNKITEGLDTDLKIASELRFSSKSLNDWLKAKKIYESYLAKNPNDVIVNYRLCEFHTLVNSLAGQKYCEKAVELIESNQDSRLSSKNARDLYLSDVSQKTCEVSLYNKDFDKAIMYCQKSLDTNFTKSDPMLMKSVEVILYSAKRRDNSVIVLARKPVCESDPSSLLCN